MDYFEENKEVEDLEKKTFEENYKKQAQLSKKIFKIMGCIFLFIAILLIVVSLVFDESEVSIPSIPLGIVGMIFLIIGFVFHEKYNYEAIKKRQHKYGYVNIYELNAKVIMLEEKNKSLESRIKELENEIRKFK